jgi:hypothetical protein
MTFDDGPTPDNGLGIAVTKSMVLLPLLVLAKHRRES